MTALATLTATRPASRAGPGSRIIGVVVVLILWELAARGLHGSYMLAGPSQVGRYLWQNAGLVGRALAVTLREAGLGFVFGNLAAVAMAAVAVLLPRSERLISALALLCFCLPLVATGPILRVLYGPGAGPQITLAALAVYYTTYLPLLVGLKAAPAAWFDLVRSYGRGRLTELVQVRGPAALPYLIAGLQIAAPAAFLGAMVGEFTGAERGMGVLAIQAMRGLDISATWALATVAAGVSVLVYAVIGSIGRWLQVAPPPLILAAVMPRLPRSAGAVVMARIGLGALILATVLAIWTGAMAWFDLNPFFAKRPADVWAFLVTAPEAAANRATLAAALTATLGFAVPGYVAGDRKSVV